MRKLFLTTAAVIVFSAASFAQQRVIAYIDSDYLLNSMPSYAEAQAELDRLSVEWQKEIEARFKRIDEMYRRFQQEAMILPEEAKLKRQNEIIAAENEAKDLQRKRFGTDGDLFKKREELIKPIQDRVFTAVEEYAKERGYSFVFDKAGVMTIVYADSKNDINDAILTKLGVTPGKR